MANGIIAVKIPRDEYTAMKSELERLRAENAAYSAELNKLKAEKAKTTRRKEGKENG
jgi:hypothetical protein